MFGPLTTEREKNSNPICFNVNERAIPNQNKNKSRDEGHVYIEYFDSWSHYKIWNAAVQHELEASDAKYKPWHTTYKVLWRVNGQNDFFNFVIKFFSNGLLQTLCAEEAYDIAKIKLKISFCWLIYLYFCIQRRIQNPVEHLRWSYLRK